MFRQTFIQRLMRRRTQAKPLGAGKRPAFSLVKLEYLEDRTAPATLTWTGTAGPNWSSAGNWSGGGVPSAVNNDLIFNSTGVTNFTSNNDIAGLTGLTITITDASATAGNDFTINSTGATGIASLNNNKTDGLTTATTINAQLSGTGATITATAGHLSINNAANAFNAASTVNVPTGGTVSIKIGTTSSIGDAKLNLTGGTLNLGVGTVPTAPGLFWDVISDGFFQGPVAPSGTVTNAIGAGLSENNEVVVDDLNPAGIRYWVRPDGSEDNMTYVYQGQIFDADGIFSFGENIDDSVLIRIDGVEYLNTTAWNTPETTTTLKPDNDFGMGPAGDGWHDIDIRLGEFGGGAGAVGGGGFTNGVIDINGVTYPAFGFGFSFDGTGGADGALNIPVDSAQKVTNGAPVDIQLRHKLLSPPAINNAVSVSGNSTINMQSGLSGTVSFPSLTSAAGAQLAVNSLGVGQTLSFGTTSLGGDATFNTGAGAALTLAGVVSETAPSAITKSGTGTMTLGGVNTYTGLTNVTAGQLTADANGALGTAAAGTVVSSGARLQINTDQSSAESYTLSGTGTASNGALFGNGDRTVVGPVTLAADTSISTASSANGAFVLAGVVSGGFNLTKVGSGNLLLAGNNTYTGTTNVVGGGLVGAVSGSFGTGAAPITVQNTGALGLLGGTTYNIGKPLTIAGNGPDGNGALQSVAGTTSATFASVTLATNASIGARAGDFTLTNDITIGNTVDALTLTGAGNVIIPGKISDPASSSPFYYVGFTGATGGENAQQSILNWTFTGGSTFNYASGFAGSNLALNRNASIQGNQLQLTPQANDQTGTAWVTSLAGNFTTSFQFQFKSSATSAADGIAFVIQNAGLTAIGGGGGGLGYANLPGNSIAVEINMYNDVTTFGVGTNGSVTERYANDLTPYGIDFHSLDSNGFTDVFQADISYVAATSTMTVTFKNVTDATAPQTFSFPSTTVPSTTPSGLKVNKTGAGTATLSNNANSYTGVTTISNGTLAVAAPNALGALSAGTTVQSGGSLGLTGGITLGAEPLTFVGGGFNGSGAIKNVSGANTISLNTTLSAATSIGSDAGTLTVNGTINESIFPLTLTGAGDLQINAAITSATTPPAGLLVGQSNSGDDEGPGPNPAFGSDIDVTTTMGNKAGGDGPVLQTSLKTWATNNTWFYQGQIFVNNTNGDGTGTIAFAEHMDDNVLIRIDGVEVLNNNQWDNPTTTGNLTYPTGWHDIDIRFANGGGGAGPSGAGAGRPGWSTNTYGFGYRVVPNPDDGLSDADGSNYLIPTAGTPGPGEVAVQFRVPTSGGGTGGLIKTGTGNATLAGANTFTGPTSISGGKLVPANSGAISSSNAVNISGSGTLGLSGGFNITQPISIGGAGAGGVGAIENISGNNTITGAITEASSATFGSTAGTLTINGNIAAVYYTTTFTGAGDIVVNGVISSTDLVVAPGLRVGQSNNGDDEGASPDPAFGSDIDVTTTMGNKAGGDGAVLQTTEKTWATNNTWFYQGAMLVNNTNGDGTGTIAFAEHVDDNVLIRIDGVTVLNNNQWDNPTTTGNITLPAGWHDVDIRFANGGGGAGPSGAGAARPGWSTNTYGFGYRVATGPTDPLSNADGSNYKIPTAGTPGAGEVAVQFSTFAPPTYNLVKNGGGKLTLSAANTYRGTTTINDGALLATNTTGSATSAGAVTVAGTGILGGTGTVGAVTASAGSVAPGVNLGILRTGNLALAAGSNLRVDVNGATAGTQHDQLSVTGTVNLTGSQLVLQSAFSPDPAVGSTYTIISNDGADAVVGTFAGLASGATVFGNATAFTISYTGGDGNDVVLTTSVAPIPTTTTTLVATPLATTGGSSVMFTATVAPSPGAAGTVTFLDNGAIIPGAANAALVGGVAVFSTTTLSNGTHPVTAYYSGATGFGSSISNVQNVVIGSTPALAVESVTVNGTQAGFTGAQRSRVVNLTVAFSQPVQLDAGAITLGLHANVTYDGTALPGGMGTVPTLTVTPSSDNKTFTVTFTGAVDPASPPAVYDGFNSLRDGVYDYTIDATKVHPLGQPGTNLSANSTGTFHRLYGDSNAPTQAGNTLTAVVNTGDNLGFRNAFNKPVGGGYIPYFDFNGDGTINSGDNLQFRNRFNKALSWTV